MNDLIRLIGSDLLILIMTHHKGLQVYSESQETFQQNALSFWHIATNVSNQKHQQKLWV